MSLVFFMYLAGVTESIAGMFVGLAWFCAIITIGTLIVNLCWYMSIYDDTYDKTTIKVDLTKMWKILRYTIPIFLIAFFTQAAMPSEKTMYMMLGAKIGEDLVHSPQFNQTTTNIMNLVNAKLVSMTNDVTKAAADKVKDTVDKNTTDKKSGS